MSRNPPSLQQFYKTLMTGVDPSTRKVCHRCYKVKSILAFATQSDRTDGLRPYCRACARDSRIHYKVTEKECRRCGEVKPIKFYYKKRDAPDGLQPYCIPCRLQYQKDRMSHNAARSSIPPIALHWCNGCHRSKPPEEFNKDKRQTFGLAIRCKACHQAYRDRKTTRAEMSHRATLRVPEHKRIYTDEERELSVLYRVITMNDPCWYCHERKPTMYWSHIIPFDQGGTDLWHNLRRACNACTRKHLR